MCDGRENSSLQESETWREWVQLQVITATYYAPALCWEFSVHLSWCDHTMNQAILLTGQNGKALSYNLQYSYNA